MSSLPRQIRPRTGHMIVCGDDGLAHRLSDELREVYREHVTLVTPAGSGVAASTPSPGRARATALFGRVSSAMTRVAGTTQAAADDGHVLEASEVTDDVLAAAGVARAAALALVYEDDEVNIRTALIARRLNPQVRLVIRLYNRKLGQQLEELLDQAVAVAAPELFPVALDASTTVLSDADTAAPALAATAVADTSKVVQADGLLLRAVERTPPRRGEVVDPGLCTLALLSATANDPAGAEGSDRSGTEAPQLLPDENAVTAATGRGTVVLEAVSYSGPVLPTGRLAGRGAPLGQLFSRRLRWSFVGLIACACSASPSPPG